MHGYIVTQTPKNAVTSASSSSRLGRAMEISRRRDRQPFRHAKASIDRPHLEHVIG
jgi:hypothetical protein